MASNFHSLQISTASLQRKRKNRNWKNFVKKGFQSSSSPSESNHFYRLSLSPFDGRTFARILKRIIGIIGKKKRQDSTRDFWHLFLYPSSPIYRDIPSINPAFRRVRLGIGPSVGWKGRVGRDRLRFAGRSTKEDDRRGRRCVGDNPFQRSHGF